MNGFESKPIPAEVRTADTEEQLVAQLLDAMSSYWKIGRCAAELKAQHGWTDAKVAERSGSTADQICQCRLVWERFGPTREADLHQGLSWSHFYAARTWEDAADALRWASDLGATVAEMKAWRRAQHGEDLTAPADQAGAQPVAESGEGREGTGAPERVNRNRPRTTRGSVGEGGTTRTPPAADPPPPPPAERKRAQIRDQAHSGGDQRDRDQLTAGANIPDRREGLPTPAVRTSDREVDPGETRGDEAGSRTPPNELSTRPLSAGEVIVRIREMLRLAERDLEPDALAEISDELRGWSHRFAPARDPTPPDGQDTEGKVDALYAAYPRKVGRAAAYKAIRKALRSAPFEELLTAVQEFARSPAGKAGTFTPHPASWFNAERWNDDRAEWHKVDAGSAVRPPLISSGDRYDPSRAEAVRDV